MTLPLITLDIAQIDRNLLTDLDDDATGWDLYEAEYEGATVSNQRYQVVFSADAGRAGIVFCGSGSSGQTSWTDAASPDEAMHLFHADEMRG